MKLIGGESGRFLVKVGMEESNCDVVVWMKASNHIMMIHGQESTEKMVGINGRNRKQGLSVAQGIGIASRPPSCGEWGKVGELHCLGIMNDYCTRGALGRIIFHAVPPISFKLPYI